MYFLFLFFYWVILIFFFHNFIFYEFFFIKFYIYFFTAIFFPLKFFLNGYFFHGFMISMVADAINPSWLVFCFHCFFKIHLVFFLFFSFNIKLFNEWASWYYSTCLRTHSPWYYGWVRDFVSWSRWAHIRFFFTFFKYIFSLIFILQHFICQRLSFILFLFFFFMKLLCSHLIY